MEQLSACLPPAKVLELVKLNQALELAVHEAHAANAAVAAVAQVLASKQAAALRAREVAGAATKRLRRFMAELDTQVGGGRMAAAGTLAGCSREPGCGAARGQGQSALLSEARQASAELAASRLLFYLLSNEPSPCTPLTASSCALQFGIQSKFGSSRQAPLSPAKPPGLASPTVLPSAAPLSPVAPPLAIVPNLPVVL